MGGFQANLDDLDKAARLDLPTLAKVYETVLNQIELTDGVDQNAAADPPVCRGAGTFAAGWTDLRLQIVKALAACKDNATEIGNRLGTAVDIYAASEAQIKAHIDSLNEQLKSQVPG